jgi:endonuclease/exonuclease/phosphatase family metal-dependent hydrolase
MNVLQNWVLLLTVLFATTTNADRQHVSADDSIKGTEIKLRLATFNVSLYGKAANEVSERLATGNDPQAIELAAIVQTIRPDILLLNEIDHHADARAVRMLVDKYFAVGRDGREAIEYDWVYSAPSNTGIDSTIDLDKNGRLGDPADAWGFGNYPGQYASAIVSRYPIDRDAIRTFQSFRWADFPNALRPEFPDSGKKFYDETTWQKLRLSSKNHVDVPIRIGTKTLHVLASHPTPPVFDGPEDRNGCRNHDEILFWVHYIDGDQTLVDDNGQAGGLPQNASFVVMGDLNSDPVIGDSRHIAIRKLLQHPRITDPRPVRLPYAEKYSDLWKQPTDFTKPFPASATADFGSVGQLRVDYVLPSNNMTIQDAKVFWPGERDPLYRWVEASDHRLVWVDVVIGG